MIGGIILAGGNGNRFNGKKQFAMVQGKELWQYVYEKASKVIPDEDIIVVGVDVAGGMTRSESVINGLNTLQKKYERIVILEAARPLVTVEQIRKLCDSDAKSVTFALPLVNTVIGRDGVYYNRNDFYDLLTPQAFEFSLLKQAYETGKYTDTTDETFVMYAEYGIKPQFIIEGENLMKVTYRRDLEIVRYIMEGENK